MRSFLYPFISLFLSCVEQSDSASILSEANAESSIDSSQEIRLDITPSDASSGLLPQSFILSAEDDWQNIELTLRPTTVLDGYVHGFSIYPYIDTTLPGEDLPVEAQIQIQKKERNILLHTAKVN